MVDMYDAVTWTNLVDKPGAVMGYADGPDSMWPAEAWQAFQGRPHTVITVTADEVYPVFDAETGDAGNEAVATAVANRVSDGRYAVVYSNEVNLPGLTQALKRKGQVWRDAQYWPEPGVYLHCADPTGTPHLEVRWAPVTPVAVQDRWRDGFDVSSCYGNYPVVAKPPPLPAGREVEMILVRDPDGHVCLTDGAHKTPVDSTADMGAYQAAGIVVVNVSKQTFDGIPYAR